MRIRTAFLTGLILLALTQPSWAARIIYVDSDAAETNMGTSWADAYTYLQDAFIMARSGDEIRVAQGTYKPDLFVLSNRPSFGRLETFQLKNSVTIRGGYAGLGASDPNQRDITAYETILSGDLEGDDESPFINNSENSYHVVTGSGTYESAILDGFTISGGNANEISPDCFGGGMYNSDSNPTVINCTFEGNKAGIDGGGMYNYDSNTVVNNCLFIANYANWGGAGMLNHLGSPILTNCIFSNNTAGYFGGGMQNDFLSSPIVTNCTFSGNIAGNHSGCMYNTTANVTVRNCILWNNSPNEITDSFNAITAATYSNIQGGWPGQGNINENPLFADPNKNDYHLKSQAGRWDPNSQTWVQDDVTSPYIDAGDPTSPIGHEPFPNRGIINMGAYGGTAEASKSYFDKPVCEIIVAGDINGDCLVDFKDFTIAARHWLKDHSTPNEPPIPPTVCVQWFAHASVKIWAEDQVIYVDPRNLSISPHDATLVLVTHTHGDHYSPGNIANVSGPGAQLIGPADVVQAYGSGQVILPGQTIVLGDVRITGVPAYNISKPNHPKSNNWLGFIVELAGRRIYCAGDTDLIPEMSNLGKIDVAFLPAGGTYTMNATEAA